MSEGEKGQVHLKMFSRTSCWENIV